MNYINTYKDIECSSEIMGANPWQTINLLLKKLKDNLNASITAIKDNKIPLKCKKLSNANDIIIYLQDCLNRQAEPELCKKLDGIYEHLQKLIVQANAKNSVEKLEEIKFIVDNIATWWDKVKS